MKIFLFIRGLPGAGKITTARALRQRLGWRIFWQHDIRNAVVDIVGNHFIADLADKTMKPIIHFLVQQGQNVIFVRSDLGGKMVKHVARLLKKFHNYKFCLVTLMADKKALLKRSLARGEHYRIPSRYRFNKYLATSPALKRVCPDELIIDTTKISVQEVADKICKHFKFKK